MNEDEIRELLREMGYEPVPADAVARVRAGVTERLRRRARGWWFGAVATAAACIVLLAVWLREPAAVPRPAAPVVAMEQPVLREPEIVVPEPVRKPVPVRRVVRKPAAPAPANVVIRIETPDPNVVILLVSD